MTLLAESLKCTYVSERKIAQLDLENKAAQYIQQYGLLSPLDAFNQVHQNIPFDRKQYPIVATVPGRFGINYVQTMHVGIVPVMKEQVALYRPGTEDEPGYMRNIWAQEGSMTYEPPFITSVFVEPYTPVYNDHQLKDIIALTGNKTPSLFTIEGTYQGYKGVYPEIYTDSVAKATYCVGGEWRPNNDEWNTALVKYLPSAQLDITPQSQEAKQADTERLLWQMNYKLDQLSRRIRDSWQDAQGIWLD